MIERQCAVHARTLSLRAVSELSDVLQVARVGCLPDEYEQLNRGVGLAIGAIQCHLLNVISAQHPELDDLR
jgi:hypothetical protein